MTDGWPVVSGSLGAHRERAHSRERLVHSGDLNRVDAEGATATIGAMESDRHNDVEADDEGDGRVVPGEVFDPPRE